jgi:hypothetical protein
MSKANKIRILVVGVIVIAVIIKMSAQAYQNYQIKQEFLAKGIYEIGDTFTYVMTQDSLAAIYMVCEPPSDPEELKRVAVDFI